VTSTSGAPELFTQAVAALRGLRPRPELQLGDVRAPQRLAPWAYAFTAEINGPADELATGRLILLHDPLLPAVGWSWLTDALAATGAEYRALGGTVTDTSSARFGDIAGPARTDDLELRASWTPVDANLAPHGEAFFDVMASVVGLPPVGVTLFSQRQGS
jgi:hypothetical protein